MGRRNTGWQTEEAGWLKNTERRLRRDRSETLTDRDIEHLLLKIEEYENYTSSTLGEDIDRLTRFRDKGLIATAWIWFKRGGEVLNLKRGDVAKTNQEFVITFSIEKKLRRIKVCSRCGETNGFKSNFCKRCREDLRAVEIEKIGGTALVTKRKSLKYKFVKYILEWLNAFDRIAGEDSKELILFPPLRVRFTSAYFDFKKSMTIQNFDRILKRLDSRMTSCLFRYGGAEKFLTLGYTPYELKEIGDWESSHMPEVYAKRKGITATQRRWSEDLR